MIIQLEISRNLKFQFRIGTIFRYATDKDCALFQRSSSPSIIPVKGKINCRCMRGGIGYHLCNARLVLRIYRTSIQSSNGLFTTGRIGN